MRGFARIRYPPVGRDRYLASVAQSRCCVDPVTLLPLNVAPMQAPVFGERAVFRSGDAPKAPRSEIVRRALLGTCGIIAFAALCVALLLL